MSAQFGWDAVPPLADVVAHLANVVAAYDPRDRLQFVEMASSVYAELSRHDAADVGRLLAAHDALRDWVWHGDGFARPAKLVAAAPFTDLRPYVYSLPTEMTGSEPTTHTHTHTHTRLTALCPGLPGSAGTREIKPSWISLNQETVSGSGISWAICKSAPRSTPAPHHSVFYRPDALPAAKPTASKH